MKTISKIFKISVPYWLILLLSAAALYSSEPVDLNCEDLQMLEALPVSDQAIEALLDFRYYHGYFNSIYQVRELKNISYEEFLVIKQNAAVYPLILSDTEQRTEDNYFRIEQMTFSDGTSEGLVDRWVEMLSNPEDVNDMDYTDLMNLPGVSPVDAQAVTIFLQDGNMIRSARDLRGIEGISYYGYRNISNYVQYEPVQHNRWFGSFNTTIKNVQLNIVPDDDPEALTEFNVNDVPLDVFHKLHLGYGKKLDFGLAYTRALGQPDLYYYLNSDSSWQIPQFKGYAAVHDVKLPLGKLNSVILGNYVASFGQGVVMESVDYFTPRKSGYGWRKRLNGIEGDISRNEEYSLRGVALEYQVGQLYLTPFFSYNSRDAIINADSSFSSLIRMQPRLSHGLYGEYPTDMTNSVHEMVNGANIRWQVNPGTQVGFNFYESLYDRELDVQLSSILLASAMDNYLSSIGNAADSEIESMYESYGRSGLWSKAKSFRRVMGVDASTVINNITLQGEIGVLDKDGDLSSFSGDPIAWTINSYWQFANFNLLLLYRDYDLDYDNPYQRSFSNYQRYKSSIFEDSYYLQDPALGFLYTGASQPQAERGFYYSLRYQLSRALITSIEHDIWSRVADEAKYNRLVLNLEYRPVFSYRVRLRQKWQSRAANDLYVSTGYNSSETRIDASMNMSRFNDLGLLLVYGFTEFDPRPRLMEDPVTGGEAYVGNAGSPSRGIGATFTHNFNGRLKVMGMIMTYEGFVWNFEDTDFRVFNTLTQAFHGYVSVFSRLNDNFSVRLKYSFNSQLPVDNIPQALVRYDTDPDLAVDASIPAEDYHYTKPIWYLTQSSDFRLQLDYRF